MQKYRMIILFSFTLGIRTTTMRKEREAGEGGEGRRAAAQRAGEVPPAQEEQQQERSDRHHRGPHPQTFEAESVGLLRPTDSASKVCG